MRKMAHFDVEAARCTRRTRFGPRATQQDLLKAPKSGYYVCARRIGQFGVKICNCYGAECLPRRLLCFQTRGILEIRADCPVAFPA